MPVHFFALWLDQDFGKGKSQGACSTYNNTQLSANENFAIESLEVWAVGQRPDVKKVKIEFLKYFACWKIKLNSIM